MALPQYYSGLGPFRQAFQSGDPILTYHHVGPRPRKVRLKGLYVSPQLFDRQLRELGAAGLSSRPLGAIIIEQQSRAQLRIFLTFDDGFRDVFDHALPLLQHHRGSGLVFLVSELLGKTNEWQQRAGDVTIPLMDEHQVREWLAAGQQIGSHTQTHPRLTQLPLSRAKEEIVASKHALEDRFGIAIEHFCYPYGDWNLAVRDIAQAAGYKTACTTDPGVNTADTSPHELKRFTARYPSRNFKAIWARLRARCGPQTP